MNITYQPGKFACCGCSVWVTDAFTRLVGPMDNLREGYLVFEGPAYLKIPLCVDCEVEVSGKESELLQNLLAGGQAKEFYGKTPTGYEKFEEHWAAKGVAVDGVWRRGVPKAMMRANNG